MAPKRTIVRSARRQRRKLPRAAREQQMLDVAVRVFARRGFHRASMDQIARSCGLTKPMLYAYFKSKEGLYLATVDRAGHYLVDSVGKLLEERDPLTRLRRASEILLSFVGRDRHGWAVLYAEGLGEGPVARHVAAYRAQIAHAAAVTLAQHHAARPSSAAVRAAEPWAVALLGAGEALARWWLAKPGVTLAQASDIAGAMVQGIFEAYARPRR